MQHVIEYAGPPSAAPTAVSQHWVDTLNKVEYFSVGTSTVADWVAREVGGGGGGGGQGGVFLAVSGLNIGTAALGIEAADYVTQAYGVSGIAMAPVTVGLDITISYLGFQLGASYTGDARVVVYDSHPTTGGPNNVVAFKDFLGLSGAIDDQELAVTPFALTPGVYWLAVQFSAAITFSASPTKYSPALGNGYGTGSPKTHIFKSILSFDPTPPDPFTFGSGNVNAGNVPKIWGYID